MRVTSVLATVRTLLPLTALLLAPVAGWAQQPTPSPAQPAAPATKKPPSVPPIPPLATTSGAHRTPVVQPQGQTHAQKPAIPPAAAPAKPAPPAVPAVVAPAVVAPTAAAADNPAAPPVATPADAARAAKAAKAAGAQPVPRFQSLRSNEVNLRAGPGVRYRIDWVYKRSDLPVEVVREFEHWRAIRDADGIEGWVNQATLNARRNFIVKGGEATLRDDSNDKAPPVATLKPGVIGRIKACPKDSAWCHVTVAGHAGYLRRNQFWGTLPNEEIAP